MDLGYQVWFFSDSGILLWQYSDKEVAPDLFGDDNNMNADDDDGDGQVTHRLRTTVFYSGAPVTRATEFLVLIISLWKNTPGAI